MSWNGDKQFAQTILLRARVMGNGYIPGSILTQSYLFSERNFTLPVVSVVTDLKNLWDDEIRIYCEGTNTGNCMKRPVNWNRDWNRPANFEIPDKSQQLFSQECDIAIGGKCSRMLRMKTLKLNAEKKYDGKNHFLYPFFQAKPGLQYKSLSLRNGGNDLTGTLMRDALQHILFEGMIDLDYQAYQLTVHFINGEYYGIINLRERNNHHLVYANYGYPKDSIDLIGHYTVYQGTDTDFRTMVSLSTNAADPAVYKDLTESIDLDEFITYFIAEIYGGNSDWPGNNLKIFRNQNQGKWRWILYDLDNGFTNLEVNTFERFPNHTSYSVHLFLNLLKNERFKQRFIDYFTICLGSVLRPERIHQVIDSLGNQILPELPYHRQKMVHRL